MRYSKQKTWNKSGNYNLKSFATWASSASHSANFPFMETLHLNFEVVHPHHGGLCLLLNIVRLFSFRFSLSFLHCVATLFGRFPCLDKLLI